MAKIKKWSNLTPLKKICVYVYKASLTFIKNKNKLNSIFDSKIIFKKNQ